MSYFTPHTLSKSLHIVWPMESTEKPNQKLLVSTKDAGPFYVLTSKTVR